VDVKFPNSSKKFPVPLHREFGHNTLTYLLESEALARFRGQKRENSLYFRGDQGISATETRSLQPPSTATQSRHFSLSPDPHQKVLKKPGNAPPIGGGSAEVVQETQTWPDSEAPLALFLN
jgi:hypothetical protein